VWQEYWGVHTDADPLAGGFLTGKPVIHVPFHRVIRML